MAVDSYCCQRYAIKLLGMPSNIYSTGGLGCLIATLHHTHRCWLQSSYLMAEMHGKFTNALPTQVSAFCVLEMKQLGQEEAGHQSQQMGLSR